MPPPPATGSAFPAALDDLPEIGPNDREDEDGIEHDVMHDAVNAAINALQGVVGAGADPDAGSIRGRLKSVEASRQITCIFRRHGGAIEVGTQAETQVLFDGEVVGWSLLADVSGSIEIDVWRDSYANYPPNLSESITASAPPSVSSAVKAEDATLAGWSKAFSAGDVFRFNVNSCISIQRATLILHLKQA